MDFILRRTIMMIICNILGDYVLQTDFIAETKGENRYHLFAHCMLYIVPFYICFGYDIRLLGLFSVHWIIELARSRYNKISYTTEQILTVLAAHTFYVAPVILLFN